MAKAPSTKPYRAVAVANGEDGEFYDDQQPGHCEESGQVVDDDDDSDNYSDGGVVIIATRQTHGFRRLLTSACLLVALAFGCRIAYVKLFGGRITSIAVVHNNFTNGLTSEAGWPNDDYYANENEFAGNDDDSFEGDSFVLDLVEGKNIEGDGEEKFEDYLDDEIQNGEVGGDFDSDMEYDEQGEEVGYENEGDFSQKDTEFDDEYENDAISETDDVNFHEDEKEQEKGEGVDDEGEGLTFEIPHVDGGDNEISRSEPLEDENADPSDENFHKGEKNIIEDADENEPVTPEEESPDYFIPLTPEQRIKLKEKYRATLRATKIALLISANSNSTDLINPSPQRTLVLGSHSPKQFMHMHHMKTGGTSLDGLIRCALQRQKDVNGGTMIKYNSISECGSMVKRCMDTLAGHLNASVVDNVFYQNDAKGQPKVDMQFSFDPADEALDILIDDLNVCSTSEANVMSYCASLHAVRTFGWKGVDKITVIRNPVDRAWSMYRYTLDRCYHCQELKDVLRKIENGTFKGEEPNFVYSPNDSCAVQMIGHQATNLLSSIDLYNVANDVRFPKEREIVAEAVRNLREDFTWIGLTDRLDESIRGMRDVFPFLAENLSETAGALQNFFQKSGDQIDDIRFSLPEGYDDTKGCPLPHDNGGREPHCGTKELDDETIYWIKRLNNRDVAVYKAAVERFTIQMEVLSEYRSGSLN